MPCMLGPRTAAAAAAAGAALALQQPRLSCLACWEQGCCFEQAGSGLWVCAQQGTLLR